MYHNTIGIIMNETDIHVNSFIYFALFYYNAGQSKPGCTWFESGTANLLVNKFGKDGLFIINEHAKRIVFIESAHLPYSLTFCIWNVLQILKNPITKDNMLYQTIHQPRQTVGHGTKNGSPHFSTVTDLCTKKPMLERLFCSSLVFR